MLRILHSLGNQITEGGVIVSLKRQPSSTHQKYLFSAVDTHFHWRQSKSQGLLLLEGLDRFQRRNSRSLDLPSYSTVPQTLPHRASPGLITSYR
jgi:hypothetical protein